MLTVSFAPSASHPLATVLVGQTGAVLAQETRDDVPWLVVEFPGYGTVSLPADQFTEPA